MFKAIKEFFVGKTPAERHPLDAVTTPNIPEPVMVKETVIVTAPYKVEPPAATTPIPLVVNTAPAKAPRKPRAPKAAPVAAVKEKAPAKAKAPKATAKSKKV